MQIKTSEVIFREDLYPRIKPDASVIQRYAENLEVLPPIEVNQHNILIDGFHRWTAHRKSEAEFIEVEVTNTSSENELFALAIKKNSTHGLQMNESDKKKTAIRLYAAGTGLDKDEIANVLSVSKRMVTNYLTDVDKDLRKERKEKIFNMYLACATLDEIAEEAGVHKDTVSEETKLYRNLEALPKSDKLLADFQDEGFTPPLYNIWSFAKKTNEVSHFGNSEQRLVDNLLYLYTEPFDIVLDPFAGGGSTIDVCRKRLRRYWVSDRKPIVERENEIRNLDICQDLPALNKRWGEVTLTYLDPPYWRQAEGQYSNDAEDFANMPLDEFTNKLAGVVKAIAKKQKTGVIALIIQPTQWKAEGREVVDHVVDLINAVNLPVENRISCPYSTEQYTPQMVNWAKENKKLLVLTRELIIWRIG